MKKTVITTIFFVGISLLGIAYIYVQYTRLNQDLSDLRKENTTYKRLIEQDQKHISSLQAQIQSQLKKNVDELSIQKDTDVYISITETQTTPLKKVIAFWVNGPEKTLFDAMDLELKLINMKENVSCTTGDVFTQYPLIKIASNSIHITGIAGISTEKITTGLINKRFATCTFEKMNSAQKTYVEMNPQDTHIYTLGKSVLNLKNSFTSISW